MNEIELIDIENSDLTTRGFEECTNIQEKEYSERTDIILEGIQLWFSRTHLGRPVTQVLCK